MNKFEKAVVAGVTGLAVGLTGCASEKNIEIPITGQTVYEFNGAAANCMRKDLESNPDFEQTTDAASVATFILNKKGILTAVYGKEGVYVEYRKDPQEGKIGEHNIVLNYFLKGDYKVKEGERIAKDIASDKAEIVSGKNEYTGITFSVIKGQDGKNNYDTKLIVTENEKNDFANDPNYIAWSLCSNPKA